MILELIVPVIILCVITVTDVFVLLSVSQEFVLAEYVNRLVYLLVLVIKTQIGVEMLIVTQGYIAPEIIQCAMIIMAVSVIKNV